MLDLCIGHVLKLLMILLKRRNFDLNLVSNEKIKKIAFQDLK